MVKVVEKLAPLGAIRAGFLMGCTTPRRAILLRIRVGLRQGHLMANAILGDGHLLAILALTAISVSPLPESALAQQPVQDNTACSNFQVGTATYMRCRGQGTRDFLIPR